MVGVIAVCIAGGVKANRQNEGDFCQQKADAKPGRGQRIAGCKLVAIHLGH